MKYNPNIHHRKSIRLKEYDYSQTGYYFVTICTNNRENVFGKIIDSKMILNELGEIIKDELLKSEEIRDEIKIDYYCIMPNHIHFILIINELNDCRGEVTSPLPKLGNIIGFFKYESTKQINKIQNSPGIPIWQRNYYEHIIRNEKELYEIRKYIENNPINWNDDEYYE